MFSLAPSFTEDNILIVLETLLTAMKHSLSLIKSFESNDIEKRVDLFSSLLFFILTRFSEIQIVDVYKTYNKSYLLS